MRTKGSLNKRTRAALHAAATGEFAEKADKVIGQLLGIAADPGREMPLRLQAASVALPYVRPKLASVEQRQINESDSLTEEEILAKLRALLATQPQLFDTLLKTRVEVVGTSPL